MISSRKSGFPSARSSIDSRVSTGRSSTASSTSTRVVASSCDSGSRKIELKFRFPPPQPDRRWARSGRDGQTKRTAGDAVHKRLEQVEQRVIRPVDVLDYDDHGPVCGEPGEERPPRLVGLEPHLARRKVGEPESRILEPECERENGGGTRGIGNGREDVRSERGDLGERGPGQIPVEHAVVSCFSTSASGQ